MGDPILGARIFPLRWFCYSMMEFRSLAQMRARLSRVLLGTANHGEFCETFGSSQSCGERIPLESEYPVIDPGSTLLCP
jgi:hypothetical protein